MTVNRDAVSRLRVRQAIDICKPNQSPAPQKRGMTRIQPCPYSTQLNALLSLTCHGDGLSIVGVFGYE
jgi:hypothetical protein